MLVVLESLWDQCNSRISPLLFHRSYVETLKSMHVYARQNLTVILSFLNALQMFESRTTFILYLNTRNLNYGLVIMMTYLMQ